MNRLQLVYILPNYDVAIATHFAHLYDLLQELSKEIDIHVIVERGQACPPQPSALGDGRRAMAGPFAHAPVLSSGTVRGSAPRNLEWKETTGISPWSFTSVTVLKSTNFISRILREFTLLKKLRQQGCERFYTHYSFTGAMAAGLVCRLWGGQSYYWNCGLPWLYTQSLRFSNFILWLRTRMPLQLAMRLATYVVTGTSGLAQMYSHEYRLASAKFKILPNWISLSRFNSSPSSQTELREAWQISANSKVILFVHRLSPRKGSHLLVPIMRELNDKAVMVVAGSGPYQSQLKRDIVKAGLENKFRLLGDVANTDIAKLMSAADVLVMPSQEEGFPRVLLEAMAVGLPFVATDVGGVKEVVPPSSLVVPSGDVKALASALEQLLSDPAKCQQLIAMGREHVKQYDISKISKMFIDLIK